MRAKPLVGVAALPIAGAGYTLGGSEGALLAALGWLFVAAAARSVERALTPETAVE